MTPPTEKGNVSPECHFRAAARLIRKCGMADKTHGPAVDPDYLPCLVEHAMRVYTGIGILFMAEKTDFPSLCIRSAPQEPGASCTFLCPMDPMTGKTSYLSFKKGEVSRRMTEPPPRHKIDRVMVIGVMMAIKTYRGWVYTLRKRPGCGNIFGRHPVAADTGRMVFIFVIVGRY